MQAVDLKGRHILVGITGGIAAYRTLEVIRGIVKAGGEVRVIATRHALEFVTRISIEALSGNPLSDDLFGTRSQSSIDHIDLAKWGDTLLVAPATANILGKMANGIADDLLSTVYLALTDSCRVVVAPAMNTQMWKHPAMARNLGILKGDLGQRLEVVGPVSKLLACGDWGMGAMAEPDAILEALK